MGARPVLWQPNPGPQTRFLASPARECGFGGAAGGGKSAALVAIPIRWIHIPQFRALILRRETNQLRDLVDKSRSLYRPIGGVLNETTRTWRFPSGATVWMNHMENLNDWEQYQGHEFQMIGVDEGTTFVKRQFLEAKARLRSSTPGLPRIMRWTSNPGGKGHDWLFERYAPWLSPDCVVDGLLVRYDADGRPLPPALPGQILWVTKDGESDIFHVRRVADSESRQFIPARLTDNPKLLAQDPDYARALKDLDPVRRAQLERGDWLIKPASGMYFKPPWFKRMPALPKADVRWCRYWDRGATEKGDWTVGLLLGRLPDGTYLIADVVRFRGTPATVQKTIRETADDDGPRVTQVLEQDPAQAGVVEHDLYARLLAGLTFRFVRPVGTKIERAGPASSQAEVGNIFVLCHGGAAPVWWRALVDELSQFPEGKHDDQVDCLSGAINWLSGKRVGSLPKGVGDTGETRRSLGGWALRALVYDTQDKEGSPWPIGEVRSFGTTRISIGSVQPRPAECPTAACAARAIPAPRASSVTSIPTSVRS